VIAIVDLRKQSAGTILGCVFLVVSEVVAGDDHCAHQPAEHSRNTVQVVDAAGVVEANEGLELGSEVVESEGRDDAGSDSDDEGNCGGVEDAAGCTDGNTTCKGCVQDIVHDEAVAEEGADCEGGEAAAGQREQRVGEDLVLVVEVLGSHSEVEGGPEHPQEEGADESEDEGVVVGSGAGDGGELVAEDPADSESEVGSEAVDEHAASHVECADGVGDEHFVEGVADDLDDGHDEELLGADLADDSSEGDEHCRHAVGSPGDEQLLEVDVVLAVGVALDDAFPEGVEEDVELDDDGVDEEGVGEGRQCMRFDKGHQKAKTNEHHHIHVLKHGIPLVNQIVSRRLGLNPHIGSIKYYYYYFSSD
jgi:hypothetical protein